MGWLALSKLVLWWKSGSGSGAGEAHDAQLGPVTGSPRPRRIRFEIRHCAHHGGHGPEHHNGKRFAAAMKDSQQLVV